MKRLNPLPPQVDLETLSDRDRKIPGGPVWQLHALQSMVLLEQISLVATPKSSREMRDELGLSLKNVNTLFCEITADQYHGSEWVLLPGDRRTPLPADSYLFPWAAWPRAAAHDHPPTYLKFTLRDPHRHLIVVSLHISRFH